MATIIDALVVELGLDASKFTGSQKTAVQKLSDLEKAGDKTEKATRKVEKASKDAAHSIDNLSRTVASFLAIIGGTVALKNWISDFIDSNAQLERLSKNLGLSVPTISAWSNATEKLGGSASALQGTLDMLSKSQTQLMITGESNLLPYMSALGISLADVHGKARPVDEILLDLADRFSKLDRTTANNLGRMMGLDQGTMNLLLRGRKELELEIKRQKEQTTVTKEQAAQAQKFQTQITGLKQRFEALGRSLLMEAAPYLEKLLTLFEKFGQWAQDHQQFIQDFLTVLAVGLGAIALATAPLNLTVLAVLALAAGIALLWDDYQTWAKGGQSEFDWTQFVAGVNSAKEAFQGLSQAIKEAFGWIKDLHDAIPDWAVQWMDDLDKENKAKYLKATGGRTPQQLAAQKIGLSGDPLVDRLVRSQRSWTGSVNAPPPSEASDKTIADRAHAIAKQVAAQTGISEDVLFATFSHETGGFTNRGARTLNNFAGINVPGGKGEDYRAFGSDAEFASYYASLLKTLYPGALGAQNAADFAHGLKNGVGGRQYFSDTESNYAGGIARALTHSYAASVAGVAGGASGGSQTSVDKSVKVDIQSMPIYTQATDADGIARDMEHSLDYLFASQANSGLN